MTGGDNMNTDNGLIIDCFAGGGGASTGMEMALGRPVDIAINHDPDAILMHKTNHLDTLHLTEDIFKVDLQKYVAGHHVALMWASPDCTSHSKAKGGKPRKSGLRILPWAVYKHAKAILPDVIIMENVEEIQQWGPLDEEGHPIPDKKGEDYKKFIGGMQSLGYEFDSRELVAADFGAPTTRRRWYAIFRRDGKPIIWPHKAYSQSRERNKKLWIPVSSVLDFTNLGKSIFNRKKPLAENTMRRIARGLDRFLFNNPEPYISSDNKTIPFLIQYHTETTKNGMRGQAITEPIQTIDTRNRYGFVSTFITKFYKTGIGQQVTTSPGHFGQVSIVAMSLKQLNKQGINEIAAQKATWVSHYIMEYYGASIGQKISEPLHTIVTKDRFALISILGDQYAILDICLRMLTPEELKLAQGFPKDYVIHKDYFGKKYPIAKQVARIGNSVVPIMAKELVASNCAYLRVGDRQPMCRSDQLYPENDGQLKFA